MDHYFEQLIDLCVSVFHVYFDQNGTSDAISQTVIDNNRTMLEIENYSHFNRDR